ncbi:MAG: ABC transporter permease [Proteobacteria bacterium]|nr:ABC transporter permease [Pseudomonadota bacterium]
MTFYPLFFDIQDAWRNLFRRPLRSLLSGLGIGIGVAALIAMLSLTEGAKRAAFEKFSSLGLQTLRLEAIASQSEKGESTMNLSQGIIQEDAVQLAEWLGMRGKIGVFIKKEGVRISAGNKEVKATVLGVNAGWFAAEGLSTTRGRLLYEGDIAHQENYCVVGSALAANLQVEVLSTIRMENHVATVVGVAARKGRLLTEGTGLSSVDFDNIVIMPLTSMPFPRVVADRLLLDGLVVSLEQAHESSVQFLAEQIRQILLDSHRQVEDFHVVVPLTLLREAEDSQKVFSLIMGAIAALSLLVGGIGVMNIMLANIAEQTREIGLRMAVGASQARIISLYLCHSILLTMTGAIWGGVVGVLVALLIQQFAGLPVVFSSFSLLVAPSFAVITGIIFGLHPARRAATLEPALALRDS